MKDYRKKEIRRKLAFFMAVILVIGTIRGDNGMVVQADMLKEADTVTPGSSTVTSGDTTVTSGDTTVTPGDGQNLREDSGFIFERYDNDTYTVTYFEGGTVVNTAGGGKGTGTVSYGSSDESIAAVNVTSGEVCLKKAGSVVITAIREADAAYQSISTQYTLVIEKGSQAEFGFAGDKEVIVQLKDGSYYREAQGGSGNGRIEYTVIESSSEKVAEVINADNAQQPQGTVILRKPGRVTIQAVKDGESKWEEVSDTYTLTIMGEQGIAFDNTLQPGVGAQLPAGGTIYYGQSLEVVANAKSLSDAPADGVGHGNGNITYQVVSGGDIATIDNTQRGILHFQDRRTGYVSVEASISDDYEYYYNGAKGEYDVKVAYLPVPATTYTLNGSLYNGWYTAGVSIAAPEGYQISYSNALSNNTWANSVELSETEVGEVAGKVVYLRKKESGTVYDDGITDAIAVETIKRDITAPQSLQVSYKQSAKDILLRALTFGCYQGNVEVTLSAADDESGLKSFVYSYAVASGADAVNQGESDIEVLLGEGTNSYTFTIPAQFRGTVAFKAYNNAGMEASLEDGKIIVADNQKPLCHVEYADNYVAMTDSSGNPVSVSDGNARLVYDRPVSAVIKITEDNFDLNMADVEAVVFRDGKKAIEGEHYFFAEETWAYNRAENCYERTLWLGEGKDGASADGDYMLKLDYADAAGNQMEPYQSGIYSVSTQGPKISIVYDNNQPSQDAYYNGGRVGVVTVEGRNIQPEDIKLTVSASNKMGVVAFDLDSKMSAWQVVERKGEYPGKLQAAITYDVDAAYEIEVTCVDLTGHRAAVGDSFTVDRTPPAPSEFTIDYSVPLLEKIISGITFKYYQPKVTVTIAAQDMTSGIGSLSWEYQKERGSSDKNVGTAAGTFTDKQLAYSTDGREASASFTLTAAQAAQYRGHITVTATDKAGNVSRSHTDSETMVVVDNIAPTRTVEYSPAVQVLDKKTENSGVILYYDKAMTMTFRVEEANFYAEDVIVRVNKKTTDLNWNKTGDTWVGILTLSQSGDYVVTMDYVDRSDNAMVSYTSEQITIDTTNPVMTISYSPSGAKSMYDGRAYYDGLVTAKITIEEHNFRAQDVKAIVTAQDVGGAGAAVTNYAEYLQNEGNWSSEGDVHQAVITFDADVNYNFSVSYKDLALRSAQAPPTYLFGVDRTNPGNLTVSYSQSILETVLQAVTFGYYNAPVSVTMTAEDAASGVCRFEYSFLKAEGVSTVNTESRNAVINTNEIRYSDDKRKASAVFRIPGSELRENSQFNGCVDFIAYDRAGRSTSFKDSRRIVVDSIAPTATITFNNSVYMENNVAYYAGNVEATVRITEANFTPEDVEVTVYRNGTDSQKMSVAWADESVDGHIGRFVLQEDGDYVVQIDYKDRSNNEMQTYRSHQLTIDTRRPEITVAGVTNRSANKEETIGFVLTVQDENLNAASFLPVLTAEVRSADGSFKQVDMSEMGSVGVTMEGKKCTYTVSNLEADGIYSLRCSVKDMAGNESEDIFTKETGQEAAEIMFSVNRQGSTYRVDQNTVRLLGKYVQSADDIVVTEINTNALSDIKITLFKNDKTIILEEGKNYHLDVAGGAGEWYTYSYTIYQNNFEDDGVYRIVVYSEDEAGNAAENTLDVKELEIAFAVDKTNPNVVVANLESNAVYPYENYTVIMQASDNLKLSGIEMFLDGASYKVWNAEEIALIEAEGGEYACEIAGASTHSHSLEIRLSDAASNVTVEKITDFYITTDKWVQFYSNKALLYGVIAGVAAVCLGVAGTVTAVLRRRKKKEKQ